MKVKNLFGMAAMAAVVMSSCSSDEVVNNYSQDNAIEFGTYVGRGAQSRASVKTTKELGAGFGVFAYYTGNNSFSEHTVAEPNFMYNQEVKANEDVWGDEVKDDDGNVTSPGYYQEWTYSPIKYWPNTVGDKISFFAYAPYNANIETLTIAKNPIVKFTVPSDDVKNQEDILYAEPQIDVTKKKIGEPVKFVFKHALSRIGFKVQTTVDVVNPDADGAEDSESAENGTLNEQETIVVIKEVELSGQFFNNGYLTPNQVVKFENGSLIWGEYNVNMYGEENGLSSVTYKLAANAESDNFINSENVTWGEKENLQYNQYGQKVNCDEVVLNAEDSYIMVIPTENAYDYNIKVVYDVVTKDANLPTGVSIVENTVTSDPFKFEFEQGKAYTFSLHLGLTSVELSASVEGWDDEGEYSVNVPINKQ